MSHPLARDPASFATLFIQARSQRAFQDQAIDPAVLESVYDLAKWGPTSMNCCPARFVFVTSDEARDRLAECAMEGNRERIRSAPATVIIATDSNWYEQLPVLAPHMQGARDRFAGNPELAETNGFRNGTLQGAYLMIAARAHGLDLAPMSGFDAGKVNQAFFAEGTEMESWQANWICCMGYGDHEKLHPRAPRMAFEEACRVA